MLGHCSPEGRSVQNSLCVCVFITAGPITAGPITAGPITAGPITKLFAGRRVEDMCYDIRRAETSSAIQRAPYRGRSPRNCRAASVYSRDWLARLQTVLASRYFHRHWRSSASLSAACLCDEVSTTENRVVCFFVQNLINTPMLYRRHTDAARSLCGHGHPSRTHFGRVLEGLDLKIDLY
jgi:hypothetical protein